jgi:hypothetical protein
MKDMRVGEYEYLTGNYEDASGFQAVWLSDYPTALLDVWLTSQLDN